MRTPVEPNMARPEPVVEFGRKKSAVSTSNSFDDNYSLTSQGVSESDFEPFHLADLRQITLPRDASKPLVTANNRYAREAIEAYKSLRTRLLKSQTSQGFRSIAITSVGRAEGKTLTAFNLACCCASMENLSVLLIDCDLRSRSLTSLIETLPPVGLADVMSGKVPCEKAVVRTDLPNLYVMGAGASDLASTELLSTGKWGQVVRWGHDHFTMVLIDALSMGSLADFELIAPECDGVLVIVRARSTPREELRMALDQLDANKLLGIVWNGSESEKRKNFYL
jgi:capsular exopolysaccharide synthesis family protein